MTASARGWIWTRWPPPRWGRSSTNTLPLDDPEAVERAAEVVREGGVVLCPTDTAYMLAADGLNEAAVRRIIEIKRRPPAMAITVIVPSLTAATRYVEVNDAAKRLAERLLPGPLTLVLPRKDCVPDVLTGGRPTLGIRVPDHAFSLALAERAGRPITATSANVSGGEAAYTLIEALSALPGDAIDLAIDGGRVATPGVSTIIDLSGERPVILREGLVPDSDVLEALS